MIIILGDKNDYHCKAVAENLKKIKEDFCFLNTYDFPDKVLLNWYPDSDFEGYITINRKKIPLKDIKSLYWRNFFGIIYEKLDGENSKFLSEMMYRERKSALFSFLYSFCDKQFNSIHAFELHQKKSYLTNILNQNNIRVPRTLITNDKNSIEQFLDLNKEIIAKPVLGGTYTEKITKKDLTKSRLSLLKKCPVQFQEYIDGTDIRVYAYENKIYSLKILTNNVDFRTDINAKLIPCELPKKTADDCIKMMKLLGLKYSGIDIRLNSKGEYIFIEANPAPMFIHAENVTGLPLCQSLIELLIK